MQVIGIIPARYASSRFPGKPLADINGKPMIQRVYEQAKKATSLSALVVATDDERIQQCVQNFGGEVVMTSANHETGTERCFEALQKLNDLYDVAINIQGDEPYIHPEQIDEVAALFGDNKCQVSTLAKKIETTETLFNPNRPKVHISDNGIALAFSRKPIPELESEPAEWLSQQSFYKHIGIYGYRTEALAEIVKLPATESEKTERLEQLRWLDNGYKIRVGITEWESAAIDTPADIDRLSHQD